jgi:hypothetical protein
VIKKIASVVSVKAQLVFKDFIVYSSGRVHGCEAEA